MAFKFGHSSDSTSPHHAHISQTPSWFFPLRIVQAILALLTLILSAVGLDYFGRFYGEDAYGLNIFTSILTFIFLVYIFVTAMKFPAAYNMWAVLGLEIALVIFWLVTFALLADYASGLGKAEDYNRGYGGWTRDSRYKTASGCTKAAAAFAAFEWVTFVVTLVFFSLSLHRHRQAGNPFMPGHVGPTGAPGTHKMEPVTHNQTGGAMGQQYPQNTYQSGASGPEYNPNGQQAV